METPACRRRVLVVEDEAHLRDAYLRFFVERHGDEFSASVVPNAEEALDVLKRDPVDLMVLDWSLPGISGASLAKAVRAHARTRSTGILMVTARNAAAETVYALESGADDYLTKPFEWGVLLARLRSLARRSQLTLDRQITRLFPGLELDLDAERLTVDGVPVPLAPKELALLKIFLSRPDVVHEHGFLWTAVWGGESAGWQHTLDSAVSTLRRKLGPAWGARLTSHKGRGYSFRSAA